jgi:thiol-disulfide isomerase/thioredoxin
MIGYLLVWNLTVSAGQSPAPSDSVKQLEIGQEAPTFALPDMAGATHFLRDYCGDSLRKPWKNKTRHVMVISFFASWCQPCKKEIPILHEIAGAFKDQPVKFFLINEQDKKEEVENILRKEKYTLPLLLDLYGVCAKNYNLVNETGSIALPRLVVLDKKGKVQLLNKGFSGNEDDFKKNFSELVAKLAADTLAR